MALKKIAKTAWEIGENFVQFLAPTLAAIAASEWIKKQGEQAAETIIPKWTGTHRNELLAFLRKLKHVDARENFKRRYSAVCLEDKTNPGVENRWVDLLFEHYAKFKHKPQELVQEFTGLGCRNDAGFEEELLFMENNRWQTRGRQVAKWSSENLKPVGKELVRQVTVIPAPGDPATVLGELFGHDSTSAVVVRDFRTTHADSAWLRPRPTGGAPWYRKFWV